VVHPLAGGFAIHVPPVESFVHGFVLERFCGGNVLTANRLGVFLVPGLVTGVRFF